MHRRTREHRDVPDVVRTERVTVLDPGDDLGGRWVAKTVRPVRRQDSDRCCPAPGCRLDMFILGLRVQRVATPKGVVDIHEECAVRMYRDARGVELTPWWMYYNLTCGGGGWQHCATRAELFEILAENPWYELRAIMRVVRRNPERGTVDVPVPGTWVSPDVFVEHPDISLCEMPAVDHTLCIREATSALELTDGNKLPVCDACFMWVQDMLARQRSA